MGQRRRPAILRRIEIPVVLGAFFALRASGLIPPVAWWAIPLVVVVATTMSDIVASRCRPDGANAEVWGRAGGRAVAIASVIGLTGWPLAIGYVFNLGDGVRESGSRAVKPAVITSLVCLIVSQVAISVGIAPSMIPVAPAHGLAVLEALGLVLASRVVYKTTRDKELAEDEVRRREVWFRSLVANASDGVIVFRTDGSAAYASPGLEPLFGAPDDGAFQLSADSVHPDDRDRARAGFHDFLETGRSPALELRMLDPEVGWRWFEIVFTNRLDDPDISGIIANLRDVTERKAAEERLAHQAFHDPLTGLPNRRAFVERLQERLDRTVGTGGRVGVLFLDVDRFKVVNDSLGHEAGDQLLNVVARRVGAQVGRGDDVARFGGDEFTIMLGDIAGEGEAVAVAQRILTALREPATIQGRRLLIAASIGAATWDGDPETDADELLRRADFAMYLAKERGRARCEVFDPSHVPLVQDRLELEADLLTALRSDQLAVHFQPEISLKDHRMIGVEALIRWNHPRRGNIVPDTFIPLAEDTGLILDIDRFVIRAACEQVAEWNQARSEQDPLRLSVNLSPQFVHQAHAADQVLELIGEAGAKPTWVQIEITERTALGDRKRTVRTLQKLRERGVRVAIDDFGTGYSSLSYLRTFPIDVLKLDRSFVAEIDGRGSGAAIVEAVISMGHALGMHVIAEGVERDGQEAMLAAWGCDSAQGFRFSPAVPAEELLAQLEAEPAAGPGLAQRSPSPSAVASPVQAG